MKKAAKKFIRLARSGCNRIIHYKNRIKWYSDALLMYVLVSFFQKKKILNTAKEAGIRLKKIEPFHFRGWHNRTALFKVTDEQNNSYFLKASKRIRVITAEAASIELIRKNQSEIPIKVIDILCKYNDSGWGFFIQPFISGSTLEELIERNVLSEEKCYELLDILSTSVRKFRSLSFVCCDFMPRNIMIDACGTPYLIDFEFAHLPDTQLGKIQLRSEQIKYIGGQYGMGIGVADDGYSLFCIAEKMFPCLFVRNYDLWLELNKGIGVCQVDLYNDRLVEGSEINIKDR